MSRGFWYRRLGRFFPVYFSNVACGGISLSNKHQVASFGEVFLQPHYWRLFDLLYSPPKVVVDLGGNCGHFPVLCEMLAQCKFGKCSATYFVVEALKSNIANIRWAAKNAGIGGRTVILHGAVGKKEGLARLSKSRHSTLTSSAVFESGSLIETVQYIDLEGYFSAKGLNEVDVLKIDIEGSEHDLFAYFPRLFRITGVLLLELHRFNNLESNTRAFLQQCGLAQVGPALKNGADELLVFRRRETPTAA